MDGWMDYLKQGVLVNEPVYFKRSTCIDKGSPNSVTLLLAPTALTEPVGVFWVTNQLKN